MAFSRGGMFSTGRVVALAATLLALAVVPRAQAVTLPSGFSEKTVFTGLSQPTAVRFSSDGRVFVAEKSEVIKEFDSLTDTTPRVYADLRTNVHDYWDRGLLGLALDPSFPGGRVANVGVHGCSVTLHLEKLWIRNVLITTGLVDTFTTPRLLQLVEGGRLDPTAFVTHRFQLEDTMEAYDVFADAAKTQALKVVLTGLPVEPVQPTVETPAAAHA